MNNNTIKNTKNKNCIVEMTLLYTVEGSLNVPVKMKFSNKM